MLPGSDKTVNRSIHANLLLFTTCRSFFHGLPHIFCFYVRKGSGSLMESNEMLRVIENAQVSGSLGRPLPMQASFS